MTSALHEICDELELNPEDVHDIVWKPADECYRVESSGTVYTVRSDLISDSLFTDAVTVSDGYVEEIQLRRAGAKPVEEWEFYSEAETRWRLFAQVITDVSLVDTERLYEAVVSELQVFEREVTVDDIVNLIIQFSDLKQLTASQGRVTFLTANPEAFYSSVSSLQEYCERVTETDSEFESLIEQDVFEIQIFLQSLYRKMDLPSRVRRESESEMRSCVRDSLTVHSSEYRVEGESILLGEFDDKYWSPKVSYFVHIPVSV